MTASKRTMKVFFLDSANMRSCCTYQRDPRTGPSSRLGSCHASGARSRGRAWRDDDGCCGVTPADAAGNAVQHRGEDQPSSFGAKRSRTAVLAQVGIVVAPACHLGVCSKHAVDRRSFECLCQACRQLQSGWELPADHCDPVRGRLRFTVGKPLSGRRDQEANAFDAIMRRHTPTAERAMIRQGPPITSMKSQKRA